MSTDHIDDHRDAEVVPLRADDAGTETRTAESPEPAYTDLPDGRPQRKPVIPEHWQSWERAREHVRLAAARHAHAAAYHGSVRPPTWC